VSGPPGLPPAEAQESVRELFFRHPTSIVSIGFGLVLVLMIVLISATLARIGSIQYQLEKIAEEYGVETALVYRMLDASRERALALHRIVFDTDPFERDKAMLSFYEQAAEFGKARTAYAALALSDKERAIVQVQNTAVETTLAAQKKVVELVQAGEFDAARDALFTEALPAQFHVFDTLDALLRVQQDEITERADAASRRQREAHLLVLFGGGAAAFLSLGIGWFAAQRLRTLMRMIQANSEHLEQTVALRTAEAREREEILRRMTSAVNDAVVMIDERGMVTFWNQAAERIFRYTADEVMGRDLHDLIMPPELRPDQQRAFAHFKETGEGQFVGQTREVTALRRGGVAFPAELSLSAVRIKGHWHAIGLARDITDRKRAEEALQTLATTDQLIGIANRRKLDEVLVAEMRRATRYGVALTFLLFDIDHFKLVNDNYGHPVGDEVLIALGQLVARNVRANDSFARWGGEEFAVLATHCDADCMEQFAEKLRKVIEGHDFPAVGHLTCSFGLTALKPGDHADDLIGRADQALYAAKAAGRNCVRRA
jgi:diguanylate cyclase (GGDEF)-like protein/PAS domain S-box-containing protein